MPKPAPQAEIQRVHDIVLRYPAGIGIARLEQELGSSISRRTLVRRLQMLEEHGQLIGDASGLGLCDHRAFLRTSV